MAGRDFGEVAEAYDNNRPHYRDGLLALVMDRLVEGAEFAERDIVVEIGPGTGLGTEALLGRGINVLGIEPDADMLAVAHKRLGNLVAQSEVEFNDRLTSGSAAVWFIHATFEDAVENGPLQEAEKFDGVAALTSLHWPIRHDGQATTAKRIAQLLKPGKRLAAVHTPLDVYSEHAADFFHASQALWPPGYRAGLPDPTSLKPLDEVTPRDFTPHLAPVHFETWVDDKNMPAGEYLKLMQTYWEMLELPEPVRERFVRDLRQLSADRFGGIVPITHATWLQIDEKPDTPLRPSTRQ